MGIVSKGLDKPWLSAKIAGMQDSASIALYQEPAKCVGGICIGVRSTHITAPGQ
jgi:hypothetical protein